MIQEISEITYRDRILQVQDKLKKEHSNGIIISNFYNIYYMTGLFHFPTERPLMLYIPVAGEPFVFVPIMEIEEAKQTFLEDIRTYFEYPGKKHPVKQFVDEIKKSYPLIGKLSFDGGSYEFIGQVKEYLSPVDFQYLSIIHDLRLYKDKEEIELLKKAAIYSDYIVQAGFDIAKPGITELELLQKSTEQTLEKMITDLHRVVYVPGGPAGGLVPSGSRTAMPHALPSKKEIEFGDTMLLSCGANVEGYRVECERTCFIGEISKEKEKVLNVMAIAQQLAIDNMKPGMKCSEVDAIALNYIRKEGYGEYLLHRTGHGKGLEEHEAPWIDEGDDSILKPGMVLSSEPGIYIEGFSGFRHSDTVVVTNDEPLILTNFSKNIENLIIN